MDEKLDLILKNQEEILRRLAILQSNPVYTMEEQIAMWVAIFGVNKIFLNDAFDRVKNGILGIP